MVEKEVRQSAYCKNGATGQENRDLKRSSTDRIVPIPASRRRQINARGIADQITLLLPSSNPISVDSPGIPPRDGFGDIGRRNIIRGTTTMMALASD